MSTAMFLIIAIALPPLAILRWKRGERAVPVIYLFGALLNAALFFQKVLGW